MYKPPNTTLLGKAVEMKFKVASGKTEWFKGQKYDGLTGNPEFTSLVMVKLYVYPNDKDMRFV